jgi:hypothetical protein
MGFADGANNDQFNRNSSNFGQEFASSPTYKVGTGHAGCQRELYIEGQNLGFVIQQYFGNPATQIGPTSHPEIPNMFPVSWSAQPIAKEKTKIVTGALSTASDINVHDYTRFTIDYELFPDWTVLAQTNTGAPAPSNGTLLNYRRHGSTEFLCIPGRHWKWVTSPNDPLPDDVNPGIKIGRIGLEFSWSYVTNPPYATINSAIGCINQNTFMGYPAGQVLFSDWSEQLTWQILGGTPFYTLTYHMLVKQSQGTVNTGMQYGWNYFYRRDPAGGDDNWQQIKSDTTGAPPYASYDISQLFKQ